MSSVLLAPTEPPAIDDGVIEEARRRQRRRRTVGTVLAAALVAVTAALVVGLAGGSGGTRAFGDIPGGTPYRLTWSHGRPYVDGQPFTVAVSPALQPGDVGLCVTALRVGSCNGQYPGPGLPLFDNGYSPEARVGPQGEIDYVIAGPGVAAVRVPGLGTYPTVAFPGLPAGDRLDIFYRPPGSVGTVLTPDLPPSVAGGDRAVTLVPLDARGHVIPTRQTSRGPAEQLPARYFAGGTATPSAGRCAVTTTLAGARVQWGETSLRVSAAPGVPSVAFLSCLDAWFTLPGGHAFEVGMLLDGRAPGTAPPALWGADALAGHPGVVEVPAVEEYAPPMLAASQIAKTIARARAHGGPALARRVAALLQARWTVAEPAVVARPIGSAWLLVRNGGTVADDLQDLASVRVTRLAP